MVGSGYGPASKWTVGSGSTTHHSGDLQPIVSIWKGSGSAVVKKILTFLTKKFTLPDLIRIPQPPGIATGVGHTVGIMVDAGGRLHLLVNGVDQGVAAEHVPDRWESGRLAFGAIFFLIAAHVRFRAFFRD